MDWKYKHFHQERDFPAPPEDVVAAARSFMADSLGWKVNSTADGLTAAGDSFTHHAIANFHIQPEAGGAKVAVDLLVERAGWQGFMLFDVGGYYSIQIRKWLDGIQWSLHSQVTGTRDEAQNPLVLAAHKPSARIFNGCLIFILVTFALYVVVTFISAVIGLLTGNLFLLGRGSVTVHGIWARILSGVILVFGAFLVLRATRKTAH